MIVAQYDSTPVSSVLPILGLTDQAVLKNGSCQMVIVKSLMDSNAIL